MMNDLMELFVALALAALLLRLARGFFLSKENALGVLCVCAFSMLVVVGFANAIEAVRNEAASTTK